MRFIMYLAIFAASVVQAVAVVLLWSRMENVPSVYLCIEWRSCVQT